MCGLNLDSTQLVSVSASQLEKASRFLEDETGSSKENVDKNGVEVEEEEIDDDDYESMQPPSSHPLSATSR